MSESTLLISQVSITQPVIDESLSRVRIATVPSTVAVTVSVWPTIAVSRSAEMALPVAAAAAKEPVKRIQQRNEAARTGGRRQAAQKGDGQKQGSDAESHTIPSDLQRQI